VATREERELLADRGKPSQKRVEEGRRSENSLGGKGKKRILKKGGPRYEKRKKLDFS